MYSYRTAPDYFALFKVCNPPPPTLRHYPVRIFSQRFSLSRFSSFKTCSPVYVPWKTSPPVPTTPAPSAHLSIRPYPCTHSHLSTPLHTFSPVYTPAQPSHLSTHHPSLPICPTHVPMYNPPTCLYPCTTFPPVYTHVQPSHLSIPLHNLPTCLYPYTTFLPI
jgi:hypothetical protein